MDTSAIDKLVGELRGQLRAPLGASPTTLTQAARSAAKPGAAPEFASVLKASLDAVNRVQVDASQLAREFELGASKANLSDVMISIQKANLSFQQMVQVRNRLVAAYHDIMNMQV